VHLVGRQRLEFVGVHDDRARGAGPYGIGDRAEEVGQRESVS
jgi:hypothetical protein